MVDYMSDVDNKIWKVDYKRLMVDYKMSDGQLYNV